MRLFSPYLLLSALLGTLASCQHAPGISPCNCREAGDRVQTVSSTDGTVGADSQTRNYAIFTPRATASSPVLIGVLCDSLPGDLAFVGKKVRFDGTYYAKANGRSADTIRYYLSLTQVSPR